MAKRQRREYAPGRFEVLRRSPRNRVMGELLKPVGQAAALSAGVWLLALDRAIRPAALLWTPPKPRGPGARLADSLM